MRKADTSKPRNAVQGDQTTKVVFHRSPTDVSLGMTRVRPRFLDHEFDEF